LIKIDFKRFIYNRVWFGYGRGASFVYNEDKTGGNWKWKWVKLTTWNNK